MAAHADSDDAPEAGRAVTPAADRRPARRPGRSTGAANLGVALVVLVVLLPLLLNAATAAPPTAPEFSPNANQIIKKAPQAQAAAVNGTGQGHGPGQGSGPGASPTPSPVPSVLQVPQGDVKTCVGPPPLRQIEDPQSPPCIPYWQGNNGGATAQGVTRDNIYIAIPTPNGYTQQYTAMQNFFNKRFQFYGRKLVFEYCTPQAGASSQGSGDQAHQDQDAAGAAAGCTGLPKPFASTFYQFDNGRYYNLDMGCRYHVVTVSSYTPFDSSYLRTCAPYVYQYPMKAQDEFGEIGAWACNRLVGRPARWGGTTPTSTGGPALNTMKRKFGIFLAPYYHDDPVAKASALSALTDRLKACGAGVPSAQVIINPVDETQPGQSLDPVSASNAIAQMKQANVTSIFCLCGLFPFGALARAADSDNYQPEWMTSTYGLLDAYGALLVSAAPPSQMQHVFGLTFVPRQVNPLLEPLNAAFQEGDPTLAPATSSGDIGHYTQIYRPMLMLAAGIQMAGPHLTPETFLAGLRRTQFPNPITAIHAGAVGVSSDGYSFTDDAAEWWWSNTAKGPYSDDATGKGSICYLDAGIRHTIDTWPRSEPAYFPASGACDSGA